MLGAEPRTVNCSNTKCAYCWDLGKGKGICQCSDFITNIGPDLSPHLANVGVLMCNSFSHISDHKERKEKKK